ncbi:MAG: hypothetical protein A2413_05160 [Treponema sp. RIFOXYC1_FULL_61_9]|nr:MAG: hypothetical protein A2413_05160 [Treponema sp. RIFOXYC1_FULL_61_9]
MGGRRVFRAGYAARLPMKIGLVFEIRGGFQAAVRRRYGRFPGGAEEVSSFDRQEAAVVGDVVLMIQTDHRDASREVFTGLTCDGIGGTRRARSVVEKLGFFGDLNTARLAPSQSTHFYLK